MSDNFTCIMVKLVSQGMFFIFHQLRTLSLQSLEFDQLVDEVYDSLYEIYILSVSRDVASVSAPRSRGRLEAFQRLASVSPRKNFQTPRSRLGLGLQRLGLGLGLGSQGLGNNF